MADILNGLFISEILADNAGGAAFDTDGNGTANKSDEFIEIQNATGDPISLDGYEIWSDTRGEIFSFGAGDILGANQTATVVGNYDGAEPAGFFDAGLGEGANFLPDGENISTSLHDSIYLVDTATGNYIVLSYGSPPQAPNPPALFPGTTLIGAGESIGSGAPNGTAFARDTNGDLVETNATPGQPNIPCFLRGTLISTARGQYAIEDIVPGDLILTRDGGFKPVRGIGRYSLTRQELQLNHNYRPVCIPSGTLGNARDLWLSPSHRFLLETPLADLLFASNEVLVSANNAIASTYARQSQSSNGVTYFHLLLDDHELIQAEGAWVESLYLGDVSQICLQDASRWVLADEFDLSSASHEMTIRPVLRGYEANLLLAQWADTAVETYSVAQAA